MRLNDPKTMNESEQRAVISICVLAAFADGSHTEAERAQLQKVAEQLSQEPALANLYQEVLGQKLKLNDVAKNLSTLEGRTMAHEMAVCVCTADSNLTEKEKQFLQDLRHELQLDPSSFNSIEVRAAELADVPPLLATPAVTSGADQDLDQTILNAAILAGALELLPSSLATMAIIPVQIRMVYQIGRRHGFELSSAHVKDFLATVGVGMSAQVLEGYARKLAGSLSRSLAGKFFGGMANTVTGSAVTFGTTYALGQVAKRYYAQGRRLEAAQLREIFSSLLSEGNVLQQRYATQIMEKSRQINLGELIPLVRGR